MSTLHQKRLDKKRLGRLSGLLDRAEREKDTESAAALRWAVFTLENVIAAFEEHEAS